LSAVALLLTSIIISLTGTHQQQLDFSGARLLGLAGGLGLSIIIGQIMIFSLSLPFLLGLIWLVFTVIRLLLIEAYSTLSFDATAPSFLRSRSLI
jgi:hypothetical protein